jgi:hypothetical protein
MEALENLSFSVARGASRSVLGQEGPPIIVSYQKEVTADAESLAQDLIDEIRLPPQAAVDALYIAVATVHGMDYLLTWNCTHIANAAFRSRIEAVCRRREYEPPIIYTPQELQEESENV